MRRIVWDFVWINLAAMMLCVGAAAVLIYPLGLVGPDMMTVTAGGLWFGLGIGIAAIAMTWSRFDDRRRAVAAQPAPLPVARARR